MKIKNLLIVGSLFLTFLLTGCGVESDISIDKNGDVTSQSYFMLNQKEYDILKNSASTVNEAQEFEQTVYGDTNWYRKEIDNDNLSDYISSTDFNCEITEDLLDNFYVVGDENVIEEEEFVNLKITFPYDIIISNGQISEDKRTVIFNEDQLAVGNTIYAYTVKTKDLIKLSTGKNRYTNKKKVTVETLDKIGIIKVNKKKQRGKVIKLKKDGKYTINVKTLNSKKKFVLYRDIKKPTIKDLENDGRYRNQKKIEFSDKYGIKSATLNGKSIKNGHVVKTIGDYELIVTDKAGNTTKVSFLIW